jgi:glycosyltransferase involved in cell wall biosynthesis
LSDTVSIDRHGYLFLYAPSWFGATRFSKHHLAHHLASRGARVLFVESPLTPLSIHRGPTFAAELGASLSAPRLVEPNLWVRRHFLPVPFHAATRLTDTRLANRIGQRLLAPVIRRDVQRLDLRRPIIIASLPHAADALALLPKRAVVYHCADDYSAVSGFPHSLPELEADLCRQADLVITTSETLCRDRQAWNPNTYWVANGADVDHFSRPAAPAPDLNSIPRPILGFVGGLSEWVDFDLLGAIADLHPEWSLVLIGPPSPRAASLVTRSNVYLLGARPYPTLPSYLAGFDVALIPFKRDQVTHHADPIKAYEYLAAGLPVVATDMPALRRLLDVVWLADSVESFERAIELALAHGSDGRVARQQKAAKHSWAARFAEIEALIAAMLARDPARLTLSAFEHAAET